MFRHAACASNNKAGFVPALLRLDLHFRVCLSRRSRLFFACNTVRPPSLKSADFQRALGSRPVARTAHFSLHALPRVGAAPPVSGGPLPGRDGGAGADLSTGAQPDAHLHVDELAAPVGTAALSAWRLGLVLPKKQARRSVTRSLMRHQAREAFRRHAPAVRAAGRHGAEVDGWVVRLRAPFDRKLFPSAASAALHAAVRHELDELWARLSRGQA